MKRYLQKFLKDKGKISVEALAYWASLEAVSHASPEIAEAIVAELRAQRSHLKLIASENYCSLPVQLAMGNLLTDKYSEGYVGHRFYAGCEQVDIVEGRAKQLAEELFGADHAYVQPHSGADANLVAFWAILTQKVQMPELERLGKKNVDELSAKDWEELRQLLGNQRIMGLGLGSGGHLTHGFRQNVSAKMFRAFAYEVDPITGLLDYGAILRQAKEVRPLILIAGYSAYSRLIDFAKMREIADEVGAVLMVDMAHFAGLVAGKVLQGKYNPIPFAHIVTSTTHKILRGPRGGIVLATKEYASVVDRGCPLVLGGPLPHVMAAKAIAFQEALSSSYQKYAHQVVANARALAGELQKLGGPVLTGGTDNHLFVLDVAKGYSLTGRMAESALRQAFMTVNRNSIPQDPLGAWYTSGLRIGTPALTTLGMKEKEMEEIAHILHEILSSTTPEEGSKAKGHTNIAQIQRAQERVRSLLSRHPLYPELGDIDENWANSTESRLQGDIHAPTPH